MKKYIVNILVFFLIIATIDYCFGKVIDYMYSNSKGGIGKEMNDVCVDNQYDVIIMGSSRAHHHYVPEILSDSLGMDCYNTGKDGNGIILMYGIYQMMTERYKPSLIIYDIAKGFDIFVNPQDQNNTRYLQLLKPYVSHPPVKKIFKTYSWQEWVKTFSSLYRFNTSSIEIAKDYIISTSYNIDGYSKMIGSMDYQPEIKEGFANADIDQFKLDYFEKFILSTKMDSIPLVCVISPSYGAESSLIYEPIIELCKTYDVPLLDYYANGIFSSNKLYFKDVTHLNDLGAREFSKILVHDVREKIN